jgi:NAD(P)H-dependent flavin oxidoreductase YrpB (nitropropane dioxygenase family)
VPELRTPLCRELGIDLPVWSVGFGIAAGPELVAAVSNAGGFGVLGASGLPAEEVRRRVARTRELTGRPFGVNVIIADFDAGYDSSEKDRAFVRGGIEAAVAEGVAAAIVGDLARDAEAALAQAPPS